MFYVTDVKRLFHRWKFVFLTVGCAVELLIRVLIRNDLMFHLSVALNVNLLGMVNEHCILFPVVSLVLFFAAWGMEKILEAIEQDFIELNRQIRELREAQHPDKLL